MSKLGRPTSYKEEYCEAVIEWMRKGHSMTEIAFLLNISKQCLYEWVEKHKTFGDAIKKGKDFSEGFWMFKGTQNIENKEFNSTLWYMNMKNRFGWKDKSENTQNLIAIDHDEIKKNLNDETKPC